MDAVKGNHLLPKDLADLILKLADQINFHWNFYVVGNVAILGWLLSLNSSPPVPLKILVSVVFMIFVSMNAMVLLRNYIFLQAVSLEFRELASEIQFKTHDLHRKINKLSFGGYKYRLWATHSIVDAGVMFILWSDDLQSALKIVDN